MRTPATGADTRLTDDDVLRIPEDHELSTPLLPGWALRMRDLFREGA